jgi:hypothetical protein
MGKYIIFESPAFEILGPISLQLKKNLKEVKRKIEGLFTISLAKQIGLHKTR